MKGLETGFEYVNRLPSGVSECPKKFGILIALRMNESNTHAVCGASGNDGLTGNWPPSGAAFLSS
jgi:hypothetical protein